MMAPSATIPGLDCKEHKAHHSRIMTSLLPAPELHNVRSIFHHHGGWRSNGFTCSEIGGSECSAVPLFVELIQRPMSRISPVSAVFGKSNLTFWFSPQSHLLHCLFGITSLPLEWRSISFGNRSGVLWRHCTFFNVTCPLSIPCGLLSMVSLAPSLYSYAHPFQLKRKRGWPKRCVRRCALHLQVRTFDLGFIEMRCIFLPVLTAIGFSASDSRPDFHFPLSTIVLIDR